MSLMTDPVAIAREQERLDAAGVALAARVAACRYCKAAKTKTGKADAECKEHRLQAHLSWVTSPLSETYWCS